MSSSSKNNAVNLCCRHIVSNARLRRGLDDNWTCVIISVLCEEEWNNLMSQPKQRTILYLRTTWLNPAIRMTLQQALQHCLNTLQNSSDTELSIGAGFAAVRHRNANSQRVCIHMAAWTQGEQVSTVPHSLRGQTQADLASASPGPSWDYLDGDAFMLISDDHCLLMLSGLGQKPIEHYIQNLLLHSQKQGASDPAP